MKYDFDIDNYLNPLLPPPWLHRLPTWLSWGLGYRSKGPRKVPVYLIWFWTFVGSFSGISVVQAVFERSSYFVDRHVVNIVGSFGATAVLLYGAIEAPFAQPRAIFFGHLLSSVIGVGITKLFEMLPPASFQNYYWLAGSLSCAVATTVMSITKTIHPPAGGTALLAATSIEIRAMGWYYIPVVILSSVLMMAVGLLTNNIQRRYPMFWFTSLPLKPEAPKPEQVDQAAKVVSLDHMRRRSTGDTQADADLLEIGEEAIVVNQHDVVIPSFLDLTYDQRAVLDELHEKIKGFYSKGEKDTDSD